MKRVLLLITSIVLLLNLLSGCNLIEDKNVTFTSSGINYNNIYNFPHNAFWSDKNNFFYGSNGLYNMSWYCKIDGRTKKLFDENQLRRINNSSDGDFASKLQLHHDSIYIWYRNGNNYIFYKFNEKNNNFESVLTTTYRINYWTIIDNSLVYSAYKSENDCTLFIYNFEDLSVKELQTNICAFGAINNDVIYIIYDPIFNVNKIYKCILKTNKRVYLGEFNQCAGDKNLSCNFTEDKVVFFNSENSNLLYVFDLYSQETNTYQMDKEIEYISCYNDFAFIVLYSKMDISSICYLNLKNGSKKKLKEIEECQLINSIDDNTAYIITYSSNAIKSKVEYWKISSDSQMEKVN